MVHARAREKLPAACLRAEMEELRVGSVERNTEPERQISLK